jgi:hypothetical protein
MEDHNQERCTSPQAIKHFKVLFSAARTVNLNSYTHRPNLQLQTPRLLV